MKSTKKILVIFSILIAGIFTLGCQSSGENEPSVENETTETSEENETTETNNNEETTSTSTDEIVTIASSSVSHPVLEKAIELYNDEYGEYTIEAQLFDDAVAPNVALQEGSINATFHQHEPYMESFNDSNNAELKTYSPPIFGNLYGLYAQNIESLDEIEDGMVVAFANDPTNRSEALSYFERLDLITLNEDVELYGVADIAENPYNLQFVETERLSLGNAYEDVDMVAAMANVIDNAGHDPASALDYKDIEPQFGTLLVINEEQPWMDDFVEILTSDEMKNFIDNESDNTKKAF